MYKAIIIDDKQGNINVLSVLLSDYCPEITIVATATDLESAHDHIRKHHPDIVFLDIELNEGSGFDLLRKFREPTFETIFVTAYSQYALQAFREQALDYLLKPIDIDALQQAALKAGKQIQLKRRNQLADHLQVQPAMPQKISLPTLEGYLYINQDDIVRCAASGSYTTFHLRDGQKILTSMHLKECEELLPPTHFFRTHHSHLVNLNYVSKYIKGRGGYILMEDGSTADVAVTRKTEFLKVMNNRS